MGFRPGDDGKTMPVMNRNQVIHQGTHALLPLSGNVAHTLHVHTYGHPGERGPGGKKFIQVHGGEIRCKGRCNDNQTINGLFGGKMVGKVGGGFTGDGRTKSGTDEGDGAHLPLLCFPFNGMPDG